MKPFDRAGWARWLLATLALGLFFAPTPTQAQATKDDPLATKFEELTKTFREKVNEYEKASGEAKDQASQRKVYATRPFPEFLPQFKSLAAEAKGTDVGAKCWLSVYDIAAQEDETDDAKAAIETLMSTYSTSPVLENLPAKLTGATEMLGADKVLEHLGTLETKNPSKVVQGAAYFAHAEMLANSDSADKQKQAHELYQKVSKEYAAAKVMNSKKSYKDLADSRLFVIDNLQIGKVAPDFECVDENGAKFKLSDYRGKVVVVDFWGFW